MVSRRFCNLMAFLLLACMPLQSIASPALSLLCDEDILAELGALHQHAHVGHDHGGQSHHGHESGGGPSPVGHACYDHSYSGIAAVIAPVGANSMPVFEAARPVSFQLFFPQQPQRPPACFGVSTAKV